MEKKKKYVLYFDDISIKNSITTLKSVPFFFLLKGEERDEKDMTFVYILKNYLFENPPTFLPSPLPFCAMHNKLMGLSKLNTENF